MGVREFEKVKANAWIQANAYIVIATDALYEGELDADEASAIRKQQWQEASISRHDC